MTIAGREARSFEWSVPDDAIVTGDSDFRGCDDAGDGRGSFMSWWGTDMGGRYQQEAGQIDRLWILDVDGHTLLVDATHSADAPAADLQELDEFVASLRFVDA